MYSPDSAGFTHSNHSVRAGKSAKKLKNQKGEGQASEEDGEGGDVVADLSPSKNGGKELPPYPKNKQEARKVGKPLPEVQRESYDWDEDVF